MEDSKIAPTDPAAAWVKLHVLAHGIEFDRSVSEFVSTERSVALRKNFYNNPVSAALDAPIPQELRVLGLIVGLNSYGRSPWRLTWERDALTLSLENQETGTRYAADIIPDLELFAEDAEAQHTANLYGGAALAFFSPRSCYFFADDSQCHFCSLAGTARETPEYQGWISDEQVGRIVRLALETDPGRIEQIMIVGGNMRDLDRGFSHHVSLARAAAEAVGLVGRSDAVSVHVATMPPRDLTLIGDLSEIENLHVMFNLEVWNPDNFVRFCPGKAKDYGRSRMLSALERLSSTLGEFRAHSLLIAGLEEPEWTCEGARALAQIGVSPIVNVYHSDRDSRLGIGPRPAFADLAQIASALHDLYQEHEVQPYWRHCGRNSIDAEAQAGLFGSPMPTNLTV